MHVAASARGVLAMSALAVPAAAWGCASLVGANFTDPSLAVADAGENLGCALPSVGDAHVRIGQLAPSTRRFDFCLAPDEGAETGAVDPRPVLAASGAACPAGLGYEEVLAPLAVAAGSYRAGAVAVGKTCATTPLASTSFTVAAGETVTLALLGDPASPTLRALPESAADPAASEVRFVHALEGTTELDFDVVGSGDLPVTVVKPIASHVTLGGTSATSSRGAVDARGYLSVPAGPIRFGAGATGVGPVTIAASPALAAGGRYSIFASGSSTDVSFPPELFVCDETRTDGLFTVCGNGPAVDVTFDTFDPELTGVFTAAETARHDPVIAAMGKLTADVVCLQQLPSDDDKRAIVRAAHDQLPYAVWFADDLTTVVDDPHDVGGQTPLPPATPSCPASLASEVDSLFSCFQSSCSTAPHDPTAHLVDDPAGCIYQACGAASVLPLFARAPDGEACWMCILGELQDYSSFADVRAACTTNGGVWPLSWKGASGTLLLSRYPITSSAQRVLPSTLQRTTVIRASLALPNGAAIDTYCAQTTTPPRPGNSATLLPYTGAYGSGATGWQDELHLQTRQIVQLVSASSTALGHRSVLLGHLNSGPTLNGVAAYNADSYLLLSSAFGLAAAPGYTPACTLCTANPLVSPLAAASDTWEDLALLGRMPVTAVLSSGIVYDDRVILDADAGGKIPLSEHYGYRAVVRVRP